MQAWEGRDAREGGRKWTLGVKDTGERRRNGESRQVGKRHGNLEKED